ncbi:MAG: endoribonuclease YicC domain-containing protein [Thermoanaerobaculaceae bacterium]
MARRREAGGEVRMAGVLRSMTGFGQAEGPLSARLGGRVRLVSLNARFLEVQVRTHPRMDTAELEQDARAILGERLQRGRVQVTLELQALPGQAAAGLELDWGVVDALQAGLAARPTGLELAPLSVSDLLALPGFVQGRGELRLDEEEMQALRALLAAARDGLVATREREAAALLPGIEADVALLEGFRQWLGEASRDVRERLLARLRERLASLLDGISVPEDRLLAEAAMLAERADIAEEVERLGAHLAHLRQLLGTGGAAGKKLDFLLQEILREVNTTASKCREAGMGERVVDAKAAVERLREQLANLE